MSLAAALGGLPAVLGVLTSRPDQMQSILVGFAFGALIVTWCGTALTVQRLHDLGWSGLHTIWFAALALAAVWLDDQFPSPSLALIVVLVLIGLGLLLAPGADAMNRFGAPPR